nr:microtubule-associated serine/threonine-protein kinase 2-like isoform X1 [Penaeus vannamei]
MGVGGHAPPHLPPIFLMADYDHIPTRGYNLNARKPSQDSGAVMVSGDDFDAETPSHSQNHLHLHPRPTRRVSAPSVLGSVREDPSTPPPSPPPPSAPAAPPPALQTTVMTCASVSPAVHRRKMAMAPLSLQVVAEGAAKAPAAPLRRVRSLDKLPTGDLEARDKRYLSLPYDKSLTRYIRKKQSSLPPLVRETSLTGVAPCERLARRKGSTSVLKVVAIPEDCGGAEGAPEVPDSGRGSVDSGEGAKVRAQRQISIDEGIGAECLVEEDAAVD